MRKILLFLIPFLLFAYKIEHYKWSKGDTFYGFLKENHLPLSVYYNLPSKLKKRVRFIKNGVKVFILRDNNNIKQALIPLDSENQLQIYKRNSKYLTRIVPIIYDTTEKRAEIVVKNYLSYDVYKATGLHSLASKIASIFSDRVNFRALPANTKIEVIYNEKSRLGKIQDVNIVYAKISNRYYTYNAFLNPDDGKYYDSNGKSLAGMFLRAPLKYKRISSKFGRRFHPILHKWRMHDGIDYVNRVGTPIKAIADGKVVYKGWIKGYGKAVKIKHKNGYISLYAHLHGFKRGLYVGKWIKQGQVIAYLGNTGLSTGPHLHFGLMHNGRWVNPMRVKGVKITLSGKKRRKFLSYVRHFSHQNNIALK